MNRLVEMRSGEKNLIIGKKGGVKSTRMKQETTGCCHTSLKSSVTARSAIILMLISEKPTLLFCADMLNPALQIVLPSKSLYLQLDAHWWQVASTAVTLSIYRSVCALLQKLAVRRIAPTAPEPSVLLTILFAVQCGVRSSLPSFHCYVTSLQLLSNTPTPGRLFKPNTLPAKTRNANPDHNNRKKPVKTTTTSTTTTSKPQLQQMGEAQQSQLANHPATPNSSSF